MRILLRFTATLFFLNSIAIKAMDSPLSEDTVNAQIDNHEMVYQEALQFRDNKVQGFSVTQSEEEASARFLKLARLGHAKAMHNYAVILCKKGKYQGAYNWFLKAAALGLEPSRRNCERLKEQGKIELTEEQIGWNDLPPELQLRILSFLTVGSSSLNALCQFSAASKESMILTEDTFQQLVKDDHPLFSSHFTPWKVTYLFRQIMFKYLRADKNPKPIDMSAPNSIARLQKFYHFCNNRKLPHTLLLCYIFPYQTFPEKKPFIEFVDTLMDGVEAKDIYSLELSFVLQSLDTGIAYSADNVHYLKNFYVNAKELATTIKELIKKDQFFFIYQTLVQYCSAALIEQVSCHLCGLGKQSSPSSKVTQQMAFKLFSYGAGLNRGFSQNKLGLCYSDGIGTQIDLKQAVYWITKATEQGNLEAYCNLGSFYANGEGVARDHVKSLSLNKIAAKAGITIAQYNLGVNYSKGQGIDISYPKAIKWLTRAAEAGHGPAQLRLGLYYEKGKGVPQDKDQARWWLKQAAKQKEEDAECCLGEFYETVGEQYKAVKWYTRAAAHGDTTAKLYLGMRYIQGNGVEKNPSQGMALLREAADHDDMDAQYNLGVCYISGEFIPHNYSEAIKWFRLAANKGHYESQYNLNALLSIFPTSQ